MSNSCYPIYTKENLMPSYNPITNEGFDLPFDILYEMFLDDMMEWKEENNIDIPLTELAQLLSCHNTSKLLSKLPEDVGIENDKQVEKYLNFKKDGKFKKKVKVKILTDEQFDSATHYYNRLREYSDRLSDHLVYLHDVKKHPLFGANRSLNSIIKDLKTINYMSIDNIGWEYEGHKLVNSVNRLTSTINHWFPEVYEVIVNTKYSLFEQVKDKDLFYDRIFRMVALNKFNQRKRDSRAESGMNTISKWFWTYIKVTNGNQIAYNFPVPLAKWIYRTALNQDKFKDVDQINIGDLSMGWGGRLAGLLAAMNNTEYNKDSKDIVKIDNILSTKPVRLYGTDVNKTIHDRYSKLLDFWKQKINSKVDFDFYKSLEGAENIFEDDEFKKMKGKLHFMFTSPPYFNKEKYSEDPKQSYIKYSKYDSWRDDFLKPSIKNSFDLLVPGGELWINIADIKNGSKGYWPIENDTVQAALDAGFEHNFSYKMVFGVVIGSRQKMSAEELERLNKSKEQGNNVILTKNSLTIVEKIKDISSVDQESEKIKHLKWEPIFVFEKPFS